MKVISRYKDYYDYLQGVYGVDEKLVLDRDNSPKVFDPNEYKDYRPYWKESSNYKKVHLYICGYVIEGIIYDNKIYFGKDVEKLSDINKNITVKLSKNTRNDHEYYNVHTDIYTGKTRYDGVKVYEVISVDKYIIKMHENYDPNKKYNCPIMVSLPTTELKVNKGEENFIKFPLLSSYGVQKVLSPHDIWIMLSDWLGKQKDEVIQDKRTNNEKILTNGFDLKTSFRNVK